MKKASNNAHVCGLFDMVKIDEGKYLCQSCGKEHDSEAFEAIKKATPIRICYCGGISKRMQLYIPAPVSGYDTKPLFYVCSSCGSKYMYFHYQCDSEGCSGYCDISEVFCHECRTQK